MAELKIYRSSAVFATVHISKDTMYQGQFMGENKVVANFNHPSFIDFSIGDYIVHKGKQWRLNEVPTENKTAKNKYQYSLVFEGREYTWHDKQLMHLGVSDFTFFGTPLELITLLVNCINEIDPGWLIGTVDNTADPQFFSFKDQSVRQALTTVAETFKMEFAFDDRTLNFRNTIGNIVPGVTLSQGKGKGLYTLTRQPAGNASVATRVYGYGGTQNIPADYRGGLTRLTFAERKVDNNIATYGIIETSVTFDDIIPERLAAITGTANPTTVTDTTLDFDLNSVIVQGQAKIVFISGDLAGNEFEITSYDHASKTIKFNSNQEENGYIIPNATVKPKSGDQYKLVGITMPQTYIDAAELRVKTETTNYANSIKHPPVSYGLEIDQLQAKANGLDVSLKLGDKLHTVDTAMGVDETLRVQAFSYPLISPAEITATISDKVTYTRAERIRQIIAKQQESIREIVKGSAELQRINSIRREELQGLVFDPDGFFKTDNIRPLSIDTNMLTVGSRSQEFTLSVIFKPNFNGDANRIDWTAGALTHFTIGNTVKTWTIATGSKTAMVPATSYYIYARCSKAGTTGTMVFDTVQRKVDADATYYYFLVGVLSSVIDGIRWPTLTYGTTEVNGGFIRTGRIESNDGKAWLDLTNSQFSLGDSNGGLDWNVTSPNELTIVGRIVATSGNIGGVEIDPITGKLQVSLQKVTEAGAITDRIITARGFRPTDLLTFPTVAPGSLLQAGEAAAFIGNLSGIENTPGGGESPLTFASPLIRTGDNVSINLSGYVTTNQTINGKALSGNITLSASDVGALTKVQADGLYSLLGHTHTFASLTSKPTTIGGYGITDAYTKTEQNNRYVLKAGDAMTGPLTGPSATFDTVKANIKLSLPTAPTTFIAGEAGLYVGNLSGIENTPGGGESPLSFTSPLLRVGDVVSINLSDYATQSWTNSQGFLKAAALTGFALESWVAAGYEPKFSKGTAFNKNFGITAGSVAQGNDSRILNGQTAFGWGNYKDFGLGQTTYSDRVTTGTLDNDLIGAGFYGHSTGAIGNPEPSTQGSLWISKDGNGWTSEIHLSSGTRNLRFRRYNGTAWTDWKKVWDDSNFNPANYSLVANTVLLTGNQTINGIKKFDTAAAFYPAVADTLQANGVHIFGSAPGENGGTYINATNYLNQQAYILRNYVLAATGEQLTLALGSVRARGVIIDAELAGAVSHVTFNRSNNYVTSLGGTLHFQTKLGAVIGINDSLLSLNADQTINVRGQLDALALKATQKMLIPTTAPTGLVSGDAAFYIGNLSGITT